MKQTIFLLLFLGIGPYFLWSNTGIVTDYKLRSEKLEVANILTTKRKCLSTAALFHQCGLEFQHNGESRSFDYQFLAFGSPEFVFLLRGTQSRKLTSSVAQDYFWSRVMTIILGLLISLLTLVVVLKSMFGPTNNPPRQAVATRRLPEQRAAQNTSVNGNGPIFGKRPS